MNVERQRSVCVPVVRGPWGSAYGVVTRYIETGHGPAVVFIHGSGVGGSGTRAWGGIVRRLGTNFHTLAPDMIWSGYSTIPELPYALEMQVDHLAGFLDALGIEQATVVGQSMGAYIAARFACEYYGRVSNLVLVASNTASLAMGIDIGTASRGRQAKDNLDGSRESLRALLETNYYDKSFITEELLDEYGEIVKRPGMAEARESYRTYVDLLLSGDPTVTQSFVLKGRLENLQIPMCIIWGSNDEFAPVELGRELSRLLPKAAYVEIDKASHAVFRDQPERFAESVRSFIS